MVQANLNVWDQVRTCERIGENSFFPYAVGYLLPSPLPLIAAAVAAVAVVRQTMEAKKEEFKLILAGTAPMAVYSLFSQVPSYCLTPIPAYPVTLSLGIIGSFTAGRITKGMISLEKASFYKEAITVLTLTYGTIAAFATPNFMLTFLTVSLISPIIGTSFAFGSSL